jgi:hypothetical protein
MRKVFSILIVFSVGLLANTVSIADKVPKPDIVTTVEKASKVDFEVPIVLKVIAVDFVQENEIAYLTSEEIPVLLTTGVADLPEERMRSWRGKRQILHLTTYNSGFSVKFAIDRINPQSVLRC